MNTPDPNNPQPGDRFKTASGHEPTIVCTYHQWALCDIEGDEAPSVWYLHTVATWTPVAPTPPDRFGLIKNGKCLGTYESVEQIADLVDGERIARYTFAEWVTP